MVSRPAFPMSKRFFPVDLPLAQLPFTLETLGTFLLLSSPTSRPLRSRPGRLPKDLTAARRPAPPSASATPVAREPQPGRARRRHYRPGYLARCRQARAAVDWVGRGPRSPAWTLFPEFPPVGPGVGISRPPHHGDRHRVGAHGARAGAPGGRGQRLKAPARGGHFLRFLEMYRELSAATQRDPSFVPSRPVVPNPGPRTRRAPRATRARAGPW